MKATARRSRPRSATRCRRSVTDDAGLPGQPRVERRRGHLLGHLPQDLGVHVDVRHGLGGPSTRRGPAVPRPPRRRRAPAGCRTRRRPGPASGPRRRAARAAAARRRRRAPPAATVPRASRGSRSQMLLIAGTAVSSPASSSAPPAGRSELDPAVVAVKPASGPTRAISSPAPAAPRPARRRAAVAVQHQVDVDLGQVRPDRPHGVGAYRVAQVLGQRPPRARTSPRRPGSVARAWPGSGSTSLIRWS